MERQRSLTSPVRGLVYTAVIGASSAGCEATEWQEAGDDHTAKSPRVNRVRSRRQVNDLRMQGAREGVCMCVVMYTDPPDFISAPPLTSFCSIELLTIA